MDLFRRDFLRLAIVTLGGAGVLGRLAFVLPIMGTWYDASGAAAAFRYVAVLPIILTIVFVALMLYYRSQGGYRAVRLDEPAEVAAK